VKTTTISKLSAELAASEQRIAELEAMLTALEGRYHELDDKLRGRPLELGETVCTWITPDKPLVAVVARLHTENDTVGLVGIGTDGSRWVTRSGACIRVHRPEDQHEVVVPTWTDDALVEENGRLADALADALAECEKLQDKAICYYAMQAQSEFLHGDEVADV
jgi:hypothetical protein